MAHEGRYECKKINKYKYGLFLSIELKTRHNASYISKAIELNRNKTDRSNATKTCY